MWPLNEVRPFALKKSPKIAAKIARIFLWDKTYKQWATPPASVDNERNVEIRINAGREIKIEEGIVGENGVTNNHK